MAFSDLLIYFFHPYEKSFPNIILNLLNKSAILMRFDFNVTADTISIPCPRTIVST